jgi:PEGA domain
MITSSSARVRPAFLACAALSAALLLIPGAASAGGHGGGRGGHRSGGGVSRAGGGVSRGSGSHISRPSSRGGVAHNGGAFRGGSHRGGGHRGGRHRGGFHPRGGWGYYPYSSWGWGWWPYSSWWWGGPSVYVVAGGDSDGEEEGSVGVAARTGRYAIVKTDISPEEAQIYLDGKYIGSADDFDGRPDFLYLGPGKYHVEFRLPNYEAFATDLDVTRGQRVRLDQKLKLESGKSALDQFAPESKGTPLGRVFTKGGPEETEEAAPAPLRRHSMRRDSRDDGWSDRGMAPAPRERIPEERVDVRDEPLPRPAGNRARMKFKVTPADAAVYVDDRYLGAGEDLAANPRGVVTDPGTHSITVTRPGYKTKTVDITVRIGAPVDVVVELEK